MRTVNLDAGVVQRIRELLCVDAACAPPRDPSSTRLRFARACVLHSGDVKPQINMSQC